MNSLDELKGALPEPAKDIRLNLSSLASETILSDVQKAGTFIVSAIATRNASVTKALIGEFASRLTAPELAAAQSAAAIMAMNNVYYRFTHLASSED